MKRTIGFALASGLAVLVAGCAQTGGAREHQVVGEARLRPRALPAALRPIGRRRCATSTFR